MNYPVRIFRFIENALAFVAVIGLLILFLAVGVDWFIEVCIDAWLAWMFGV